MMIKKIERHQKLEWFSPELTLSYPPPYNNMMALMRSPKYLMPPEGDTCLVNHIQVTYHAHIFDSRPIYDIAKTLINRCTDAYYKCLLEEEMYAIPEHLKYTKVSDTVILLGVEV